MKRLLHKVFTKLAEATEQRPKTWTLEEGHVIVPAFISGGVQYYMMKDTFNSYCGRALEALDVYEQWNMRCTRQHLIDFINGVDTILSKPTIKLQDLSVLVRSLSERMNFALPTKEIIYNFAAVCFFDENESPYHYDADYGRAKIERWKKDMDIEAFFLTVPIKTMIPLPDLSAIDLKPYLQMVDMITEKETEILQELS
jgi:hypothetical protein